MVLTEERLRNDALELDSLLVAFEDRYLHFVDLYDESQTPKEIEERDRACVAFYRIRDMISELALKSTEMADIMLAEHKAAERNRTEKQVPAKTAPYLKESEEENKFDGLTKVVSTLGVVKVVNTENGKMYSPSDIAEICGSKCGQKWVERNLREGNRAGIKVVSIHITDRSKTGRRIGYYANFVSEEDAEKIMDILRCPSDIAEWIHTKVFGYKFRNDSAIIGSSEIKKKCGKRSYEKESAEEKSKKNNVTYRDGELKVSWA